MALLPASKRKALLDNATPELAEAWLYDWRVWAREKQIPPPGDWYVWLLLAGRGYGKTRTGVGLMQEWAMERQRWMAWVAKTPADARDYMVEGPGGVLRNTRPCDRPEYEPSKRRLTWPNGTVATIYSSEEPDQLRGFSGDKAWLDEFAKYANAREVWDNLQFGMREAGGKPQVFISSTPRPLKILQEIIKMDGCVKTTGSSYENKANLSPDWFTRILAPYEGTRLGRQEIHAEILTDIPGALWKRDWIQHISAPEMSRVVVAIDPAVTSKSTSDEVGIVAAGIGVDGRYYVLADRSGRMSPDKWGNRAINLYSEINADRVVAEVNNGGDLVETVLRTIDRNIPYTAVRASRGKVTRAEPIAALYEQGKVSHVGDFTEMEDQLTEYVTGDKSPDRLDALVWAITALKDGYKDYSKWSFS